jgi:hypothetical protein
MCSGIFGSSKASTAPTPIKVPESPTAVDTAYLDAKKKEEERLRKSRGIQSTVLTGQRGLLETATSKKTTLG